MLELRRVGRFERELLRAAWAAHEGESVVGVDWVRWRRDEGGGGGGVGELEVIAACMGGRLLALICDALARDYLQASHGMPDLFLWRDDGGACAFVEVKGPGDSLSCAQQAWLLRFATVGADARVTFVKNSGANG